MNKYDRYFIAKYINTYNDKKNITFDSILNIGLGIFERQ
jgi:hypothetical protein